MYKANVENNVYLILVNLNYTIVSALLLCCANLLYCCLSMQLAKKIDRLEQELFQVSQELRDAENRAEHATGQLNVLLLREKKIMKEKRDAQRQLDHAKLQIARNLRYNNTCTSLSYCTCL